LARGRARDRQAAVRSYVLPQGFDKTTIADHWENLDVRRSGTSKREPVREKSTKLPTFQNPFPKVLVLRELAAQGRAETKRLEKLQQGKDIVYSSDLVDPETVSEVLREVLDVDEEDTIVHEDLEKVDFLDSA
jgi:hypothetical protein